MQPVDIHGEAKIKTFFLVAVGGSCLNSSSYSYMEDLLPAPTLALLQPSEWSTNE